MHRAQSCATSGSVCIKRFTSIHRAVQPSCSRLGCCQLYHVHNQHSSSGSRRSPVPSPAHSLSCRTPAVMPCCKPHSVVRPRASFSAAWQALSCQLPWLMGSARHARPPHRCFVPAHGSRNPIYKASGLLDWPQSRLQHCSVLIPRYAVDCSGHATVDFSSPPLPSFRSLILSLLRISGDSFLLSSCILL